MPVRSSISSVLTWPDRPAVERALRRWLEHEAPRHSELLRLGFFGSYARGDAGVGSDLDLVAVMRDSRLPFGRRAASWRTDRLPVPAELLVYTEAEWRRLLTEGGRFARTLEAETVWVLPEGPARSPHS